MPEQDEEEDELVLLVREIAREVEDAFATVTYPGDDKLVAYPDSYECSLLEEAFRGRQTRPGPSSITSFLRKRKVPRWTGFSRESAPWLLVRGQWSGDSSSSMSS